MMNLKARKKEVYFGNTIFQTKTVTSAVMNYILPTSSILFN